MAKSARVDIGPLLEFWSLDENELNGILPITSFTTQKHDRARSILSSEVPPRIDASVSSDIRTTTQLAAVEEPTVPNCNIDVAKITGKDDSIWHARKNGGQFCSACGHCNEVGLNWCTECGTAVTLASCSSMTLSCANSIHHSHMSYEKPSKICSIDVDTTSSIMATSSTTSHAVKTKPCLLAQTHTGLQKRGSFDSNVTNNEMRERSPSGRYRPTQTSVRYWGTSGLYTWRKPSSLTPTRLSPTKLLTTESEGHSSGSPGMKQTRTMTFPSTLLCLPDEMLLLILSYLSQSQLAVCMLVCHRIYAVASDPCLWNLVLISRKRNVNNDVILNVSWRNPRRLMLVHSSGRISTAILQKAFSRMTALQELILDTCNFGSFSGDQLLISASIHCRQLSSVDIKWIHLTDKAFAVFVDNCMRLRKVIVENIPKISLNTFHLLMQKHTNSLTHVSIKGKMGFSASEVVRRCASDGIVFPNILSFSTDHVPDVKDLQFKSIILFPRLLT